MTSAQIRTLFKESSGRYDLDGGTAPLNDKTFIQAGCRWLDINYPIQENTRWHKEVVTSGNTQLDMAGIRLVRDVWAMKSGGDRIHLTYVTLEWMKENYDEDSSEITSAAPKYWSPYLQRLSPEQKALTASDFDYDIDEVLFDTGYTKRGIMWMPPLDDSYTISVYGDYFQETLSDDTDVNYWSIYYPEAIVQAAMLCLERFYRNFEGVRDQQLAVADIMKGHMDDIVEQEIIGTPYSQMEG